MNIQKYYWKAIGELEDRVKKELNGKVDSIIVYGSVVQGEATQNSDIDILIVGENINQFRDKISEISYDIDLKYSTLTTLIYLTPGEITSYLQKGSTFLKEVLTEGVVLYGREKLKPYYREEIGTGRQVSENR